ncbi:carbohydrate-binding module family 21 protein [Hypoxylon trugodes]|uniref:carbohydrate-binding module family 21 protein n=1 Tax=Hypoxylon trugodes TaxID=326681 RepID=UPI00218E00C7|nr:carbohydrate-binding module family 21 protein [Hypoxylon trugodes]KAI1384366.1 carbohydrate-binding module family 21 protein [Hypoxylon trugodes]
MPYTPPSHRSPASSAPSSPDISRRSSFNSPSSNSPRPALPRSASYLSRHRRTSSSGSIASIASPTTADGPTPDITPPGTSDNLKGMVASHATPIRQSPPPVADAGVMPPGALISPPDSSSEDEGAGELEERGRQIENIKELKEAISSIPQHRAASPVRSSPGDILLLPGQAKSLAGESRQALLTASLPALSTGARKISHSRSNTDSHIYMSKSAEASITTSEEGSEQDEPPRKPQMVRKKSGELVRPALRGQRRPSSMPGTPTFSKAVHFDSHLEHVRHFLQVDRPLAVSAGTSPADNYESDNEYPFGANGKAVPRSPPFEWELVANNFPAETPIRKALPVRLERVWMSPDQKCLIGSIAVANLAFQKSVVCRFTFDYWKTTSEVAAEYHHEIRPQGTETGFDRFQFSLKLSDFANLEAKTLFFCIRYNVNGLEYWDNNDHINFQVDFRKKMLPFNGGKGVQGTSSRPANGLPRSTRRANPSTAARPRSMPVGALDDFGHDSKFANFDQPLHEVLGESGPAGLRLKSSRSTTSLPSDNLSNRLSAPSGQAFANRYDFGASLSAAKQAQRGSSPRSDGLYMKPNKKASFTTVPVPQPSEVSEATSNSSVPSVSFTPTSGSQTSSSTIPGTSSPSSASIASASYEEILNKYCFFNGSKQSSPQMKEGTLRSGRYDGVDDVLTQGTNSTDSSSNGSPNMADQSYPFHHSSAIHHSLRQNLNPYFGNGYIPAIGASPAESPLSPHSLSPNSSSTPTGRSTSPGSMSSFLPLAGTSSIGSPVDPLPFHAQCFQDRFPFASDAYNATAIRG